MATNDWAVGNLYPPNGGINGIWSQPTPGGLVFPQQVTASIDLFSTKPYSELSGQFIGSCGHSFNACMVFREYDVETSSSVALLTCPLCGCVQRTIEPYEAALVGSTPASLANQILYP
jgi:hypothetical protein